MTEYQVEAILFIRADSPEEAHEIAYMHLHDRVTEGWINLRGFDLLEECVTEVK